MLDVCEQTFTNWKNTYPKLVKELKRGREIADGKVVQSLYKRAIGYEHTSEEIHVNQQGVVTKVPTKKKYAPDTAAASLWLRNRQKTKWRDKVDVDMAASITVPGVLQIQIVPTTPSAPLPQTPEVDNAV